MAKRALDRAKEDLKTHIMGPETRLQSMQNGGPLEVNIANNENEV